MADGDELDRMPSLAANRSDEHGRVAPRREQAEPVPRAAAPTATRGAAKSAISIPLVAVLALMIIGGVGYGYVQNQQLQLANTQLTKATERIRRLEEELNVTGSTLTETSSTTREKITAQESETKRLWDASKQERDAINATRRALGNTDLALKGVGERAGALEALTAQQGKELDQQRAQLAKTNESVRQLASSNRDLIDKVNAADQTARALRASLERRVRDNEEAVAAFDKFRQLVNRRVDALSADIAALKAPAKN